MESVGEALALPIVVGQAFALGAAKARAERAHARADDADGASHISSAVAAAHAKVASDWQTRAIMAEAEIHRLKLTNDDLVMQRTELLAHCADLLAENDRLRASIH